ncbi:MAG: dihydroxy-acid dehydratase [Pirellulales bacterium]
MARSLRSASWFDTPELYGWTRQAALLGQGMQRETFAGKPVIGIANTWSELTHCNQHLRQLAEAVKRGVWLAGGVPYEFPVMSLGEFHIRPTAMFLRNLMSMDIEESIRANPLDGVVLLAGCDKTTAAALLGLASADLPAVLVTGGPQLNAHWRGETLGSCTDCRRYQNEWRAGRITTADWIDLQSAMIRSPGHCMTMGTAATLAILAEVLGVALPGNGSIPAADSARLRLAERAGQVAVAAVQADRRPSHLLTQPAFDNAIRVLHAVAGSTNAIVHLLALAGRLGIDLPLARFDELSRTTPTLVNLKPAGEYLMEDYHYAGGTPALCRELSALLDMQRIDVAGETLADRCTAAVVHDPRVLRPASAPLHPDGGLAVLGGSLCPRGAIIKQSAASPHLLRHRGRAVVFSDHHDLSARIDRDDLDVHPDDILVLQNAGPLGGPGMPEWGLLPIPARLLRQGVRDMVRISDARISGTAFGTVVVHVTPEAAVGGPLAWVQTGDWIELNVPERRLDLLLDRSTWEMRERAWKATLQRPSRGYAQLYADHVLQADQGCDFDFLTARGGTSRPAS